MLYKSAKRLHVDNLKSATQHSTKLFTHSDSPLGALVFFILPSSNGGFVMCSNASRTLDAFAAFGAAEAALPPEHIAKVEQLD